MPKTRQQKELELNNLRDKFEKSKSVVFTSQDGISVSEIQSLRGDLRKNGSELQSIKKTLLNLLLKEKKMDLDIAEVTGGLGLAFSFDDEVAAAKTVNDFSKDYEGLVILGGVLENEIIPADKVKALASLPSKEELLGKTVATIQAPISGFVNALAGTMRNFVGVLNAIKDTK